MTRLHFWALPLVGLVCVGCSTSPQAPSDDDYGTVAPFSLVERNGRTLSDADLVGHPYVASFVFTRCTGPCPQVTATMARLQGELAELPSIRLVTFTVDPEHDDPKELERYANNFHADAERWLFLTGSERAIYALLREGFKVPVERNDGADPGAGVMHSPRLVVVDRRGHIRGYYTGILDPNSPDPLAEFEDNLRRLRAKLKLFASENS